MPSLRALRAAQRDDFYPIGNDQTTGLSIYDWARMFPPGNSVTWGGNMYQGFKVDGTTPGTSAYGSSAPVFALASVRILLFSEARFQWQNFKNGKPGDLFGTPDLALLEEPWPGKTTRDLLTQAELDVVTAGNSYWVKDSPTSLQRLEPSNVKLLYGRSYEGELSGGQIGDKLIGYAYIVNNKTVAIYAPEDVAHYRPHPHPTNPFLGISWLNPCLPDVSLDSSLHEHKRATIENGANLSTVVSFDPTVSPEEFADFVDRFHRQHEGPGNGAKTLFLGGGADVKTVGQTFENLALQATQGAGEVRIAACSGIPPAIVGFSEGLKGSTLNAGNYAESRRRLADGLMRPLWAIFAGAFQSLAPPPGNARLWYDDSGIAFLREDMTDQAHITETNASSILKLVQGGWEPDACVDAIVTGDLHRLDGKHTGLFSVQLLPPTDGTMPNPDAVPPVPVAPPTALPLPAANGNGKQPQPVSP